MEMDEDEIRALVNAIFTILLILGVALLSVWSFLVGVLRF